MNTTKNTPLPSIQKRFMEQFDGSLESAIYFPEMHLILNPSFSAHYFYVSGETDEDTITTKDTDGSFEYWGKQTEEEISNAYTLARELREFLLSFNPKPLERILGVNNIEAMRAYGSKIDRIRKRAAFLINGKIVLLPGLTLNNELTPEQEAEEERKRVEFEQTLE